MSSSHGSDARRRAVALLTVGRADSSHGGAQKRAQELRHDEAEPTQAKGGEKGGAERVACAGASSAMASAEETGLLAPHLTDSSC